MARGQLGGVSGDWQPFLGRKPGVVLSAVPKIDRKGLFSSLFRWRLIDSDAYLFRLDICTQTVLDFGPRDVYSSQRGGH